jgi:hypothetical protein
VSFNLRIENLLDDAKVRFTSSVRRPPGVDVAYPARVTVPNGFWYQAPRSYALAATVPF